MELKDVKVGDEVYVTKYVNISNGWREESIGSYWVKATVERVTANQLVADGMRFNKHSGTRIGGEKGFVRLLGHKFSGYRSDEISDQTAEYEAALEFKEEYLKFRSLIGKDYSGIKFYKFKEASKAQPEDFVKLLAYVQEVDKLFTKLFN